MKIEIKGLERVEIQLDANRTEVEAKVKVEKKEKGNLEFFTGFLVIGEQLNSLPIGSTLDTKRGIFSWQPGPGFYGTYKFVFLKADGIERRKVRLIIKILPK
jgi:hypothetical protein